MGSAQQSVEVCILRSFLESDEFGLGGCQALRLQQQVIEIAVAPTTAQQRFDVSIDGRFLLRAGLCDLLAPKKIPGGESVESVLREGMGNR
jgi:hypothetical protein